MSLVYVQPMAEDLLTIGEGGEVGISNEDDGQFSYMSDATQEMRKVLLDDHDRVWQAYKYEHILNTTCMID